MLATLNTLFFVLHTALVLFNIFGWAWRPTRRWNLATLLATLVSWVGMGLYKGLGYCWCTELHWNVRREMGIHDPESSYVQLMVRILTGWEAPPQLVSSVALAVFVLALGCSVALNVRDVRRSRSAFESPQAEADR